MQKASIKIRRDQLEEFKVYLYERENAEATIQKFLHREISFFFVLHANKEKGDYCVLFVSYLLQYQRKDAFNSVLFETRVSSPLTPGSQVCQHPGVSTIETRVSDRLFM